MKICEVTRYDLRAQEHEALKRAGRNQFIVMPSPMERAIQILLLALKEVNQAGLDGKELHDITLVQTYEPGAHSDDQKYEIHAKVKHRLKTDAAANRGEKA